MICTLDDVKTRLELIEGTYNDLLTQFIASIEARFDAETRRTLARTVDFVQEFGAEEMEVALECYPLETLTKIETLSTSTGLWEEQTDAEYVVKRSCVVSFTLPVGLAPARARLTYTGGYVMPDAAPQAGQTALPKDLEAAAIEQVAQMYQLRASAGVYRIENTGGTYWEMSDRYWVPWVRAVLRRYRRVVIG